MDPPNCEWQADYLVSGGKYQYADWNGVWSKVSTTNAPAARLGHTAVWAGTGK